MKLNREKQRKPSISSGADELAAVKAAAWAWYQRGCGAEGKPFPEAEPGAIPTGFTRRPSRFKVQAESDSDLLERSDPEGSDNSLLDLYEVERITRQIERLVMANVDGKDRKGTKGLAKWVNGFWMRHALGICGTREDVVDAHAHLLPRRKHVKL
ncbi:hypothetical protein IHE45_06G083400 [Dioscorea alata]|uniref:Uncharacterized protein n=1 Tax=Dioscorea alata TaxID=55571 RepID=A0ACB7VYV0_DIOAL|nr:hypothetical protein IHE45_06G083400 [Dioscorea alata]